MTDWADVRAQFPAVERRVYLNTAGGAPISRRAAEAARRYYDQSLRDGDIHWNEWLADVESARRKVAEMIRGDPRGVAFTANASAGLGMVAQMLRGTGCVLAVTNEFPSCTLPWLQLGYPVTFVPTAADGFVAVADFEAAVSETSAVLCISHVQYRSGFRNDLVALGRLCKARGLTFVVDATQSLGALAVDVEEAAIDVMVTSGYKWVTSGYSFGVTYLAPHLLDRESFPVAGWRSSSDPYGLVYDHLDLSGDAVALEQGHPPFPGVFALAASLDMIEEIGIGQIEARVLELTRYLHRSLEQRGFGILSTRQEDHLSGISVVAVDHPEEVVAALAERDIVVSSRGEGIRVSVHYFNNQQDIDRFAAELASITREESR